MELSIIIVNWNTREHLRKCLESIRDNQPAFQFEVIVVDNASSDESAAMVRSEFPETILIENEENLGYAEGNNQAIEKAAGSYLLLLNPDTEVKPGSLDSLIEYAKSHPETAAVGCRLIGSDGRVQRSCRGFPDPLSVCFEYFGLSRVFPKSRKIGAYRMTCFDYQHEAEVDQPMASCLVLSKKALKDVGGFDKDFPIFFNEVDWCYRAKQKGWGIRFTPSAEILHHGGASTKQIKPEMVRESHKSMRRFYEKHYRKNISSPIYYIIVIAMAINSFIVSKAKSFGGKRDKNK